MRTAVDEHDPGFQFWLYPVPGTPFLQEAAYRELGTETAPFVVADQTTYGRPFEFLAEARSLVSNRQRLEKYLAIPRDMGVPHLYAGGIDPLVRGADPEFCGKNAVMISEVTDGYWIFYEGPKYTEDHKDYWQWFTWANTAIREGRFEVQHDPRQTPEGYIPALSEAIEAAGFAAESAVGNEVTLPRHRFRGANYFMLACKAGLAVSLNVRDIPLGNYTDPLLWEVHSPGQQKIASGEVAHDAKGRVDFTPESGGVYFMNLSSGACAYAITESNVPVAVYAGKGVGTMHGAKRLYFHVPKDTTGFDVRIQGAGSETVRANIYTPRRRTGRNGTNDRHIHPRDPFRARGNTRGRRLVLLPRPGRRRHPGRRPRDPLRRSPDPVHAPRTRLPPTKRLTDAIARLRTPRAVSTRNGPMWTRHLAPFSSFPPLSSFPRKRESRRISGSI